MDASSSETWISQWVCVPATPINRLTSREIEVLQGLVDGLSNLELSAKLVISEKTVKSHLTSIYRKLDVRDRSQPIVMAVRDGLATVPGRETPI